jgi:putative ABC transport system permease protein
MGGLGSNKLRTALTMLGITIGVSAVIILVSVGQSFEAYIQAEFQGIGSNLLFVLGTQDGFERPKPLTQDDVDALSDPFRVPDAEIVMPQLDLGNQTVISPGREGRVPVLGATSDYAQVLNREVVAGRFFDEEEVNGLSRVAVIGQTAIESLFPNQNPLGETVRVRNVRFTIIGVLNEIGSAGFGPGSDRDNILILPLSTAQTRLSGQRIISGDRPISTIVVRARSSDTVELAAQQIRQTMREEREIAFRDEDDFQVVTQADLLQSFGSVTTLVTLFLGILAGISLLVGGIGIMNIMLVTVTERTREIGLRKAVGAQRRDIMLQFLVEAIVLAVLGGAIGVLIAWGGTLLAGAALPDLDVSVRLSSVALATFISAGIGVFFGLYPASRAAALNPIDALRYE